jgi:hypothetical protein
LAFNPFISIAKISLVYEDCLVSRIVNQMKGAISLNNRRPQCASYEASAKIRKRFAARERKPISARARTKRSFIHELGGGHSVVAAATLCTTFAASIIATTTTTLLPSFYYATTTTFTQRQRHHHYHHHHHHHHHHYLRHCRPRCTNVGYVSYHKPGTGTGIATVAACRVSRSWRSYARSLR